MGCFIVDSAGEIPRGAEDVVWAGWGGELEWEGGQGAGPMLACNVTGVVTPVDIGHCVGDIF